MARPPGPPLLRTAPYHLNPSAQPPRGPCRTCPRRDGLVRRDVVPHVARAAGPRGGVQPGALLAPQPVGLGGRGGQQGSHAGQGCGGMGWTVGEGVKGLGGPLCLGLQVPRLTGWRVAWWWLRQADRAAADTLNAHCAVGAQFMSRFGRCGHTIRTGPDHTYQEECTRGAKWMSTE